VARAGPAPEAAIQCDDGVNDNYALERRDPEYIRRVPTSYSRLSTD
jgi:hypothetical protein